MKNIHTSGKRKRAVARVTLTQGKGIVTVNSIPLDFIEPKISRLKMKEPLILAEGLSSKVNIDVNLIFNFPE